MDKDKLEVINALLSHARNLIDEMDVHDDDKDTQENWLYQLENVEKEVDDILGQFQ